MREGPCDCPREERSGQEQMCEAPKVGTCLDHSKTSKWDPMAGDEIA